ncbi:MAG: Spy/CpxP family protein refolding chaperone [Ignavibacterium sp.]|nr:MAG: Spy/CpxP family protein refolding chaperone [Ignavibacterium sp.]
MKQVSVISLTIILFLSFTIWNVAQQNYRSRDGQQKGERFAEKLNLTEEQQSTIEQLRIDNQKEMIDLKADLERKKLDMKELKSKGNYTREEFLNRVEAVNNSKNSISVAKANNRMDIYEILTPEQKKMFDDMGDRFGKHRKMMHHRRMMND